MFQDNKTIIQKDKKMERTPVVEYNRLYQELQDAENADDNYRVYDQLMQKSDNVLNAINRVVEVEEKKRQDQQDRLTLHNIVYRVFQTLYDVANELQTETDLSRVPSILFQKRRSFYLGIFFLFLGTTLFILSEA